MTVGRTVPDTGTRDGVTPRVKATDYFRYRMSLPDRRHIREAWVRQVMDHPLREAVQSDGRLRRWGRIDAGGRYLRADGETVHNAFFDRDFTP